jgi:2,5-diketo-D-gluconate reductase A
MVRRMTEVPTITLNTGAAMPQLGFGVFQVPPDETAQAVTTAFEYGYRSIDTAAIYRNERGVGEAIRASGLARDELFITTKLWNSDQGADSARAAFETSLEKLGLDFVDLYLIHWPAPAKNRYVESWHVLEELHREGLAKAIGVSNFQIAHLRRLGVESDVVPALNQVELHPRLQQAELRDFHAEQGIATEAWSPLAQGAVLDDPVVTELAEQHGRTPGQIVLRWHVELRNVVIPKSVTPERIAQNIALFDFELSSADMERLAGLERGERIGFDPDEFSGG